MSARQVTHPQYKHYAKIALLNALFIILQFAKKKKKSKILDQCLCSQCSKHVLHLQEQKNSTDRLKK